jgi:hypothetical protein
VNACIIVFFFSSCLVLWLIRTKGFMLMFFIYVNQTLTKLRFTRNAILEAEEQIFEVNTIP